MPRNSTTGNSRRKTGQKPARVHDLKGQVIWDEAAVAQLTKLVSDGLSASNIAKEMGVATRSAVIGKCHRIGLQLKRKSRGRADASEINASNQSPKNVVRKKPQPAPTPKFTTETDFEDCMESIAVPIETQRNSKSRHFVESADGFCRYPLWGSETPYAEKMVCGVPTEGRERPYCDHCSRIVYDRMPESSRRKRSKEWAKNARKNRVTSFVEARQSASS